MKTQLQWLPISDLQPYENNPRKNGKAVAKVANSIKEFGFNQPIVVDSNNIIVVGHTRYKASKELGLTEVPVLRMPSHVSLEKIKAYRIADNKINEFAQWDEELLISELSDLLPNSSIQDLSQDTAFSESELSKWLSEPDTNSLDDITVGKTITAKWGELYTLGDHKLVCGDSTDPHTVAMLLGEEKVDCLWEDPPYGVSYASPNAIVKGNQVANDWVESHSIENDDLDQEQLKTLLNNHLKAIQPYWRQGSAIYWCHDQRFNHQFKEILLANKVHVSDTLIWKKQVHSTFVGDYCKIYEPILYGWKKGQSHNWYAERMQHNAHTDQQLEKMTQEQLIKIIKSFNTNYHEVSKLSVQAASAMHPTVKPPKLIAYHLMNSTKRGDIVYDGFCGSGSTIIACENTNRRARCIEFEPKYIDVIINRWQELSGQHAKRSDGVLWNDITTTVK
tara:strand:- start:847 stop:2190 length:1344 start_codon:yes stop_codon:yes gene_type:complete